MTIESAADRAAFCDSAGFGVSVIYRPASGGDVQIDVLWDEPGAAVSVGDYGSGVETTRPSVTIPEGLVATAQGDSIVRDGVTWTVVAPPRPDGTGMILLAVERA